MFGIVGIKNIATIQLSQKYGLLNVGGWNIEQKKAVGTISYLAEINDNDIDEKQKIDVMEQNEHLFEWKTT